jgi:hypothetical protein
MPSDLVSEDSFLINDEEKKTSLLPKMAFIIPFLILLVSVFLVFFLYVAT